MSTLNSPESYEERQEVSMRLSKSLVEAHSGSQWPIYSTCKLLRTKRQGYQWCSVEQLCIIWNNHIVRRGMLCSGTLPRVPATYQGLGRSTYASYH